MDDCAQRPVLGLRFVEADKRGFAEFISFKVLSVSAESGGFPWWRGS